MICLNTLSKKEAKRLYDIEYRRKNLERINERKRKYNSSPAGRAMQKRQREKQKSNHLKYCRTKKYRQYKKEYDQEFRSKKLYGEFWECMILVEKIFNKVIELTPDKYERDKMRGNINRLQAKQAMKRHHKYGWQYNWSHVLELSK
jgi:hypothetical protein